MKFTVFWAAATWTILIGLLASEVQAQVNITYPTNRTVLQRDKNNSATVYIRGTYTVPVERIEVQFRAVNGGATSGWTTIQNNPQGGYYAGQVDWTGGWYEMEVRGWRGDQIVGSSTLSRLGIGEVFMVAGQSNAQGYFNYGGPGAGDDRVNCVNFYNDNSNSELPSPEFIHLNSDSFLAPRGKSAWSWGRLGDQLAGRLGVPILFYNVGWYGTAVRNWRESINGTAYSVYNGEAFTPGGMPYGNLRLALQHYVAVTGIRAILWHQGEADNFANTSTSAYANDLRTLINQSRSETGRNIAWVIARTSYDNQRGTNQVIVNAQNEVVASTPQTFFGPETDRIQVPRPDGAHFQDGGLVEVANAWSTSLNDDFFNRSEPSRAATPPRIQVACGGDNTLSLTVEGGNFTSINWNNGQNQPSIRVGRGNYSAKVRDASGNIMYTPVVVVPDQAQPATPTINLEGGNMICQGSSSSLTASTSENIRWNTGQTEQRITTSSANTFTVSTTNVYGCQATSAPVTIGVFSTPPPAKPGIAVQGATVFCEGGIVTLESNSAVNSIWSDGRSGGSITVTNSGDYRVRSVDNNGCQSPESDPVRVQVNPLPAKPSISASRSTTFCAGENVTLTSSYSDGNTWSSSTSDRSIVVDQSGEFTVAVTDQNGCRSVSDPVRVQVNPLPAAPAITPMRPTTFCDRDYTILQSTPSNSYQWNTGANQREVEIRTSGEYSLVAIDGNGCRSPASVPVRVTANPLPPRPAIQVQGSTIFCADQNVTLRAPAAVGYLWSNGDTRQEVVINQANSYEVRTRNEFGCVSDPSDRVVIQVLPLPAAPLVVASGPTTFCEGDEVRLDATGSGTFFWNNGAVGQSIVSGQTGNYAARVQGSNGCYSPYSPPVRLEAKPSPVQPTIMQIGTFTLKANNNIPEGVFIWHKDGLTLQESSSLLKSTQAGAYSAYSIVQYSPTLQCVSSESAIFDFIPEVGNNGISVYPNPSFDGLVTLETLQDFQEATATIYDMSGKVVQTFMLNGLNERKFIDLRLLTSGVYIVKVVADGFAATQKLVINR